jgi:hypothetical protein
LAPAFVRVLFFRFADDISGVTFRRSQPFRKCISRWRVRALSPPFPSQKSHSRIKKMRRAQIHACQRINSLILSGQQRFLI